MSTGENINANGGIVTHDILRNGYRRFPQTVQALVAQNLWAALQAAQIATGYPFTFALGPTTPANEIWYVDGSGTLLGRVMNLTPPVVPQPPSNLQIISTVFKQQGANNSLSAAYTDTPNLSTTWTIWTLDASNLQQIVATGTMQLASGIYGVVETFKTKPHVSIFFTVTDMSNGKAQVQLA